MTSHQDSISGVLITTVWLECTVFKNYVQVWNCIIDFFRYRVQWGSVPQKASYITVEWWPNRHLPGLFAGDLNFCSESVFFLPVGLVLGRRSSVLLIQSSRVSTIPTHWNIKSGQVRQRWGIVRSTKRCRHCSLGSIALVIYIYKLLV